MTTKPVRYVRVFTGAEPREQALDDGFALTLLQQQYGEETGLRFFINLAAGKSKCASVGPSMVEFRGAPIV